MRFRDGRVWLAIALALLATATSRGKEPGPEGNAAAATGLRAKALEAMGGAEEVVFAVRSMYGDGHYYANFGHWSLDPQRLMHAPGGAKLCKLNLRTREVRILVDDPQGSIRDPAVHHDGDKLVFSYRPGGTRYFHLYQIGTDGAGLRQLTDGPFDDIEPVYLPDGDIVFPSSRCKRFVACWYTPVATLHRLDARGEIHPLSSNIVHENTPAVLPDGRILYTRWEYVDRAPQKFHGLWTMNPDGANQAIVFGNTQPPGKWTLMIDAKPIPGTDRIVAIFSPGHGNREHEGNVMILDAKAGPDSPGYPRQISPVIKMKGNGGGGGMDAFRDPYPLAPDCFLVARNKSLVILDSAGNTEEVYEAERMLHEPGVIGPRRRERSIVPRTTPEATTGRLVVADVHHGRNMEGVEPGQIKRLLILEQLPKPVNFSGVQQTISMNGTFTLKRILGTVPVEDDGSAHFAAPALRSLYFVALDEQGRTVKRMQSYCSVMPGETLSCVGCHEKRVESPRSAAVLQATARAASKIEPIAGVPDVIDYPRHVQPIWDKHCTACHNPDKPDGRVVLTGDYNDWFTQSYYALFAGDQVSDSEGYEEDGNRPARGFGSAASPLMDKLDGSHYGARLSDEERWTVQLWIDTGATYPGTYAGLRPGTPPSPGHTRPDPDDFPVTYGTVVTKTSPDGGEPVDAIVKRRCAACHDAKLPMGRSTHKKQQYTGFLNVPVSYCLNLYNLTQPAKSMILRAPLAKEAGGYGWCQTKPAGGQPAQPAAVFASTEDGDYQAILRAIERAKTELYTLKRFDMPDFRPTRHYVREMIRYGILPPDTDRMKDRIDVYATDRAYWRSLWYQPPGGRPGQSGRRPLGRAPAAERSAGRRGARHGWRGARAIDVCIG